MIRTVASIIWRRGSWSNTVRRKRESICSVSKRKGSPSGSLADCKYIGTILAVHWCPMMFCEQSQSARILPFQRRRRHRHRYRHCQIPRTRRPSKRKSGFVFETELKSLLLCWWRNDGDEGGVDHESRWNRGSLTVTVSIDPFYENLHIFYRYISVVILKALFPFCLRVCPHSDHLFLFTFFIEFEPTLFRFATLLFSVDCLCANFYWMNLVAIEHVELWSNPKCDLFLCWTSNMVSVIWTVSVFCALQWVVSMKYDSIGGRVCLLW